MRRLVTLLIGMSTAGVAYAEDELQQGKVVAVEARPYRMVHEFTASVGVLPLDALYTGLTLGGAYTLHLSDLWAWEAVGFQYSTNVDTGLRSSLERRWSVQPESQPEAQYFLQSHVVATPLFGKLALFNARIIHASTSFSLGGGLARYTDGFRPMISAGPGLRIFFGPAVSARLDVRGALVPDVPDGVEFLLNVTLSVAFNFGSRRATEGDEAPPEDPSTGFETLDELYPNTRPDVAPREGR